MKSELLEFPKTAKEKQRTAPLWDVPKSFSRTGQQLNHKSDRIYGLKGMRPIPMLKCEAQSDTGRQ